MKRYHSFHKPPLRSGELAFAANSGAITHLQPLGAAAGDQPQSGMSSLNAGAEFQGSGGTSLSHCSPLMFAALAKVPLRNAVPKRNAGATCKTTSHEPQLGARTLLSALIRPLLFGGQEFPRLGFSPLRRDARTAETIPKLASCSAGLQICPLSLSLFLGWGLVFLAVAVSGQTNGVPQPGATNAAVASVDQTNLLTALITPISSATDQALTPPPAAPNQTNMAVAATNSAIATTNAGIAPANTAVAFTNTPIASTNIAFSVSNSPATNSLSGLAANSLTSSAAIVTQAVAVPMVNDALLQDRAAVVNSNMLAKPNPTNRMDRIRDYEIQLALARRQRLEHNPALAKAALVALLEGRSPDEIKRTALLELALVARDENQLPRAQQIFAQFISRYPNDPSVPAVLLRQGLLYREMGVPVLALAKFYQVMTSALNLKLDRFEYYQSLVLQAQTEIADTYFLQAKYLEAADCFRRLLKSDSPDLNKALIQYKLIRSLSYVDQHIDVVAQAQEFVNRYPSAGALAEVRFLLANSLRQLGRTHESLQQVLLLLESKSRSAAQSPQDWAYWQQRTGNIIANQLYKEGNYLGALDVYEGLARLSDDVSWQVPVLYQIGLACERLNQYQKAIDTYTRIVSREKDLGTNATPGLRAVLDMAKWRKDFMAWDTQAERAGLEYKVTVPANKPAAPGL